MHGIRAYLPSWELPKIRPKNCATGYGFLTDYLFEIVTEFRRRNFQTHVNVWIDLDAMTGRKQDAIKKTTAGGVFQGELRVSHGAQRLMNRRS